MAYLFLFLAIASEVVATSALKESAGFSRPLPSLLVVLGYGAAFYLLSRVLQDLPIGITYAVWSGLGIVLLALVGAWRYGQTPDAAAWVGMGLIVAGVVVLLGFSRTPVH